MTIGRYIRHYLEISLMLLYTLNLAISGTKVSLFQWTLSYTDNEHGEFGFTDWEHIMFGQTD